MSCRPIYLACLLVSSCCAGADIAWGQPVANAPPQHEFAITRQCFNCHRDAIKDSDFLGDAGARVWDEYDKHRHAFELLKRSSEKVQRMLGFELAEAFTDETLSELRTDNDVAVKAKVAKVRLCLNCHATPAGESEEQHPPYELGVSCQACHGRAADWNEPHQMEWWRLVTPEAKTHLGFRNVRDPAERARLCASCHVGNLAEGKFVTHDWYAAGHPPLPSFEYSTFAAYMPVHWRPLAEKPDFRGKDQTSPPPRSPEQSLANYLRRHKIAETSLRTSYREANFPREKFGEHDPLQDLPRLKDSVISSAVVLEAYVNLVKDYAKHSQGPEDGNATRPAWPEFALYDCASCHHELRSGPGYPQRPFGKNAVGRPPAQVWPAALLKLAVLQAAQYDPVKGESQLTAVLKSQHDFERSLTATLFGKRQDIETSGEALRVELSQLIERLKHSRYDQPAAFAALKLLTDKSQFETRDYFSARQLAWTVREVSKDFSKLPYLRSGPDPRLNSIERMFDMPVDSEQLPRDVLLLRLAATQQESVLNHLPLISKAMENFDAAKFQARLTEIHEQLPPLK
jgi:hypothetical protein